MRILFLFTIFLVSNCQAAGGEWIWAGIPKSYASKNTDLYIYQGLFDEGFESRGLAPHPLLGRNIHLVFRLNHLKNKNHLASIANTRIKSWEKFGCKIVGVQLDFDAPSKKLRIYRDYVKTFRSKIPKNYELSITGLGDWLIGGHKAGLTLLSKEVDYIVFQLFANRSAIKNIQRYLDRLEDLSFPYRVGLLRSQQIKLATPLYKGAISLIQK